MGKKIIVVGQGICGTMVSWFLQQQNIDFVVFDEAVNNTASHTSGGIINPVTGRRVVQVWLDDILLPFAKKHYSKIGETLGLHVISEKPIIDFFPNPFMKENFEKKLNQKVPYLNRFDNTDLFTSYFDFEFGAGSISPAYIVHLDALLPAWQRHLLKNNRLIKEAFNINNAHITSSKIDYNGIEATHIIFCDGNAVVHNPYFSLLPFAFNKGEALIIYAAELPHQYIYKKSLLLAPLSKEEYFWVGTNYIWDFVDALPTALFRQTVALQLQQWLKIPFTIIDHKAAVRPATVERRPFVGFHPTYKNVGILNGMGTKGCSLAPYFAHQLVDSLVQNTSIEPGADVARHNKLLGRKIN